MRKKVVLFILIFGSFSSMLLAQVLPQEETVCLEELIEEALKNNPQIQAAYNTWRAAEQKIKQVESLPDPQASFAYFGENIETRVGPQEAKYGLSQKIPFPGKLHLKARAQAKLADMLKEKYELSKRRVIQEVKFVYYDLFWVDKAIQITREEKAVLEGQEKVLQRKYEANLIPQQDVLKIQLELSKLIDRLFLFNQNRKSLVARMNSLLNRSQEKQLGRTSIQSEEFTYTLAQLQKIAQQSNPELQAANLDIERAEYERSLARLDYFPDFTLGFDYIQVGSGKTAQENDGQDAWMGKIAVNLPIWFTRLAARVKEKEARWEASKKSYQDVENRIAFEVEDLYYKITTYKEIISLYKTALIPQSEQALQAAQTAYETGQVDFLNWLDAERALLHTRLAYYKAIADYQKSLAYLERVLGRDL